MASKENTENKKGFRATAWDITKSIAWLGEAAFRIFVGYLIITNFDNTIATAAAIYALVTGGVIVIAHFVRAYHK